MYRISSLIIVIFILLAGCSPAVDGPGHVIPVPDHSVSSDKKEEDADELISYEAGETYYQTFGWLSDSELLIAEVENGLYILRSYNIKSGIKEDIYEEEEMVITTQIHPSKRYIALHTSEHPASATVKIITVDGRLTDEVKLSSSEVFLDWNESNPSLLMLTAFYEDWTYDTFVYDGETRDLKILSSPDPFLKWLDESTLLALHWSEHALGGGEIIKIDRHSGEKTQTEFTNVVYFDAYEGNLLTVQPIEQEDEMEYRIYGTNGEIENMWTAPALSNYSQWFIPEVQWVREGTAVTVIPVKEGLIDETEIEFQFVMAGEGNVTKFEERVAESAFNCSPGGNFCLSGYEYENIIQLDPFSQWK